MFTINEEEKTIYCKTGIFRMPFLQPWQYHENNVSQIFKSHSLLMY